MNQPHANQSTPGSTSTSDKPGHRQLPGIVFLVLVVASIIGIAVMDFSENNGLWYWLVMVPVFAIASIALAWYTARDRGRLRSRLLWRQILHWLTLALGILLIFMMVNSELVERGVGGLIALLMFAVATILAGVHFDWRLGVLGIILAATFAAGVLMQEFFWLLFIPTLVAGVIVFVVRRRAKEAAMTAPPASPASPRDGSTARLPSPDEPEPPSSSG